MKKWSEQAWEAAKPVYERILELPFLRELADGTLPAEKFEFYIRQDSLYLDRYSRVLAHIASRLKDKKHLEDFLGFAIDGVNVEKAMHSVFLKGNHPDSSEMSKSCLLYTSVLGSQANAPVETEAAAVLPCFWVYQKVGEHIIRNEAPGNPYSRWIATYSDEAFEASTRRAIEICDELAGKASEDVRQSMTDIFVMCTRMEWLFWQSAYNLEKWEI